MRVRPYILALIIAALGGTVLVWLQPHLSSGLGDRITASVASALAVAEYINYYHRQLQHFDNMADFKQLLSGKGFRRSQMAVDLDSVAGRP
ncbi:hypothetical protein C8024_11005 [Sphingopyxis sp. BSNA05]|uniref:hypothetical protein n=1 Tax=Sphingopyxis sp. BSNA05 TaxID=1236614 RepID=UPI0015667D9A|nr:hypothetical protein [Sphingopyxis sp. BSNA05]NRD89867.1 hypothetical protein [Sphingopyxis sp. BSNA05]